jgi:hypothetical protein
MTRCQTSHASLSQCGIGDDGLIALVLAIKQNTSLVCAIPLVQVAVSRPQTLGSEYDINGRWLASRISTPSTTLLETREQLS